MSDLVNRALERLSATLMIDDEWSIRSDCELTWTGHRLAQTFSVKGPYESRGMQVCRVSSTVPVVVGPADDNLDEKLSALNHLSVADALVWHPTEGLIKSHLAAVFHEETFEWRLSQFDSLAIIQLSLLEARVDVLAEMFHGDLARWVHPRSGERQAPDDMLNVVRDVFQPVGLETSRFVSEQEFDAVEAWVRGTQCFTMGASERGLAIEVPFGSDDTSLIQLQADQIHPTLGSGLLVTLQIRPKEEPRHRTVAAIAADLNRQECEAKSMNQYGAWHEKDELLTHAHFLPNMEFGQHVTLNAAMGQIYRATWADLTLNRPDDLELGDAASIAYERLFRSMGRTESFDA